MKKLPGAAENHRKKAARRLFRAAILMMAGVSLVFSFLGMQGAARAQDSLEEVQHELEAVRDELEETQHELEAVRDELEDMRGDLKRARYELEDMRGRLRRTRYDLEHMRSELGAMRHRLR